MFLPTRNSTGKPWAAFNINAPHYFLKPTDNIIAQMTTREWIVARITSINESVVDSQVSELHSCTLVSGSPSDSLLLARSLLQILMAYLKDSSSTSSRWKTGETAIIVKATKVHQVKKRTRMAKQTLLLKRHLCKNPLPLMLPSRR